MLDRLKDSTQCATESYVAGAVTFIVAFLGYLSVGQVYTETASSLRVEALIAPLDTLSFAVLTSSATVLSLLMAALGFANRQDKGFSHAYYVRIWFISVVAIISLVMASGLLLLISIPITESENLSNWYNAIYWVIVTTSSVIIALLVAEVVALFQAVEGLINHFAPSWQSSYINEDNQDQMSQQKTPASSQ